MDTLEESKTRKTSSSTDCDASNAVNSNCTGYRMTCDGSGEAFTVASNVTTEASSSVSQTNNAHNIISQQSVQLNESASDNIKSVNNLYHPQIYKDPNVDQVPCSSQSVGNFSQNVDHNDVQGYQKQKLCMEHCGNNNVSDPSTSGTKVNETNQENSSIESRKRPSTLKLNKHNFDAEDSSSDTGNDDYSLGSEDGCIYTYRGGEHLADLPSSFFSLDMGLPLDRHLPMPPNYPVPQQAPPNPREQGSRASSPDMDFLEMDFDPGPSCEVDSGDESTPDVDLDVVSMPEENEPIRGTTPEYLPSSQSVAQPVASTSHAHNLNAPSHCLAHSGDYYNMPSTSSRVEPIENEGATAEVTRSSSSYGAYITHINVRGEHITVRRTMAHWPPNVPSSLHVSSGDLVSPREILNYEEEHSEASFAYQINQGERPTFEPSSLSAALYHMTMAKKLMVEKDGSDVSQDIVDKAQSSTSDSSNLNEVVECVEVPLSMVWSEREACERQVTQIGTSACGATAVVNVFIALGVPVNVEKINASVGTRQRANNAPLPRYILSRAVAGCTAADLVTGIQKASDGLVTARFFPTYPERAMSLSHWLADWISLGAVPILTLNLQVACEGEIPDAWHHQMVFGVSSRGIYLCNPAECVSETAIWPRLASPSVLLVKTKDVLSRFTPATDLRPLMAVPDRRFHSFNVLGQVVNVVREWRMSGWSEHGSRTRHIRIPASYQAGITVAALTGSEAHRRLMHAPQLPVLAPQSE